MDIFELTLQKSCEPMIDFVCEQLPKKYRFTSRKVSLTLRGHSRMPVKNNNCKRF
jgi:hypothetical protein